MRLIFKPDLGNISCADEIHRWTWSNSAHTGEGNSVHAMSFETECASSRDIARFRAVSRGFARYRAVSRDFVRCLCIQKQQSTNMYTHVHVHARVIPRTQSRSDSTPWCEAQATSVDTATPDQNAATAGPQHCSATGHSPFTGQAIGTRSQARQSYATRPSSRASQLVDEATATLAPT